ncbi:Hsp20/alpha crystallin family protein [Microvirga flavescens]|uniref:Hsp20/alpha crystallin family protein n=1 Tax=Microvirga flavescens TaxID=2249811 RepID=UPI000DD631A7|nr:Hsp20/alpha crystallin family protein [Microvirga flavescens]
MARNPLSPYGFGGLMESGFGRDPFLSMNREMNRMFDDMMRGNMLTSGGQQSAGMLMPQMDVSETDKEVRVRAELPGVNEKDIDVRFDDGMLTIRAEKKSETKEDKEDYHFMERSFGTFQRALRLPYAINPEEVKAKFENGVLSVVLPKGKEQERSRKIEVQSGGPGGASGPFGA